MEVKMRKIIFVVFITFSFIGGVLAHSGGTDSAGCHRNSKTGNYHCH